MCSTCRCVRFDSVKTVPKLCHPAERTQKENININNNKNSKQPNFVYNRLSRHIRHEEIFNGKDGTVVPAVDSRFSATGQNATCALQHYIILLGRRAPMASIAFSNFCICFFGGYAQWCLLHSTYNRNRKGKNERKKTSTQILCCHHLFTARVTALFTLQLFRILLLLLLLFTLHVYCFLFMRSLGRSLYAFHA